MFTLQEGIITITIYGFCLDLFPYLRSFFSGITSPFITWEIRSNSFDKIATWFEKQGKGQVCVLLNTQNSSYTVSFLNKEIQCITKWPPNPPCRTVWWDDVLVHHCLLGAAGARGSPVLRGRAGGSHISAAASRGRHVSQVSYSCLVLTPTKSSKYLKFFYFSFLVLSKSFFFNWPPGSCRNIISNENVKVRLVRRQTSQPPNYLFFF